MKTASEIQRELDELDEQFESPANAKTGKIDFGTWSTRRTELVEKLRLAERFKHREAPTATAAPALSVRELDAILRPPQLPNLSGDDRRELDAFTRNFDAALRDGDLQAAREIQKNARRASLSQEAQTTRVAQTLRNGYAETGARMFSAMITGAVATLMHELAETRLAARLQRAQIDALERKQRSGPDDIATELNDRTLRLSFAFGERTISKDIRLPIPIDRGVYRAGVPYEQHDVVTESGSMFIALRGTKNKPPHADWRCCVHRGKDAR